jgi:thymidine kinase
MMMKWWCLMMPMKSVPPVPAAANIFYLAQGCDVVGIDEAQFFDEKL